MNIRLIPYHWTRHLSVGLFVAGIATVMWWLVLNLFVVVFPMLVPDDPTVNSLVLDQFYEGLFLMLMLSLAIAPSAILAEGILRRHAAQWILFKMFLAGFLGFLFTALSVFLLDYILFSLGTSWENSPEPILGGPATAGMRYKVGAWVLTGISSGFAVYFSRITWFLIMKLRDRFQAKIPKFIKLPQEYVVLPSYFNHAFGGLASGLLAAVVWHLLNYHLLGDFYLASAMGFMTMGFMFGTLVWAIPPDLYSGWFRVLSHHRYGQRLPILGPNAEFSERFIGHFPRGLDLFVESEHGVAEIHASFVGDRSGKYAVRGLTQSPTTLKRFLERMDLTYEANSPVPLEADLKMEDILIMGGAGPKTEVEFLLLPKEEE